MINIILLNYDPLGKNEEMTQRTKDSIAKHTNLKKVFLVEIRNVKGFVNAVNEGLKVGVWGDYNIFVANDIEIKDNNWIAKMCQPNCLTGWRFNKFFLTGEPFPDFACFGMPKNLIERVGLMDTQFEDGYGFDDNDYTYRVLEAGFHIYNASVNLIHHENKTYQSYWSKEKEGMTTRNQELFIKKWKQKSPLLLQH